jgi:transposase
VIARGFLRWEASGASAGTWTRVGLVAPAGALPGPPQVAGRRRMFGQRTSVGLDVHAREVVATALDGYTGEVHRARMSPSYEQIAAWVTAFPGPVAVVYEAGPTGFGLARFLRSRGITCLVAAPSKLQRPCGDRVKTDARDALHLARLLHLGEIVEVTIPTLDQEAARDLVRAREDCRGDLMSARHRCSKLLLRQGIVYPAKNAWTQAHDRWLRAQRFEARALQLAFDSAYETVVVTAARRDRLDAAIAEMAADSQFTAVVNRLCCLRGVSTLTAFGLAVEIGDWHRLGGRSIGAYLGLVPTESSSGTKRVQGGITKTGNGHARRLLVEAAWHHRKPYRGPSLDLRRRWERAPAAAAARAHAANQRLHQRWAAFTARKKTPVVANAAIARELAGWCWSLATLEATTPG